MFLTQRRGAANILLTAWQWRVTTEASGVHSPARRGAARRARLSRVFVLRYNSGENATPFKQRRLEQSDPQLRLFSFLVKVIYTKYSKHEPYTVAHTFDCVCSKMDNS